MRSNAGAYRSAVARGHDRRHVEQIAVGKERRIDADAFRAAKNRSVDQETPRPLRCDSRMSRKSEAWRSSGLLRAKFETGCVSHPPDSAKRRARLPSSTPCVKAVSPFVGAVAVLRHELHRVGRRTACQFCGTDTSKGCRPARCGTASTAAAQDADACRPT